ncbi:MAG TPA: hypothetical protein VGF70_09295 [Solirubrobacteraceae bacterium]
MGYGVGVPAVFLVVGIALAVKFHSWAPAGILIAFAIFGTWLLSRYGRPGRWGR